MPWSDDRDEVGVERRACCASAALPRQHAQDVGRVRRATGRARSAPRPPPPRQAGSSTPAPRRSSERRVKVGAVGELRHRARNASIRRQAASSGEARSSAEDRARAAPSAAAPGRREGRGRTRRSSRASTSSKPQRPASSSQRCPRTSAVRPPVHVRQHRLRRHHVIKAVRHLSPHFCEEGKMFMVDVNLDGVDQCGVVAYGQEALRVSASSRSRSTRMSAAAASAPNPTRPTAGRVSTGPRRRSLVQPSRGRRSSARLLPRPSAGATPCCRPGFNRQRRPAVLSRPGR